MLKCYCMQSIKMKESDFFKYLSSGKKQERVYLEVYNRNIPSTFSLNAVALKFVTVLNNTFVLEWNYWKFFLRNYVRNLKTRFKTKIKKLKTQI